METEKKKVEKRGNGKNLQKFTETEKKLRKVEIKTRKRKKIFFRGKVRKQKEN